MALLLVGLSFFVLWAALFEIDQFMHTEVQLGSGARIMEVADGGYGTFVQEAQSVTAEQRLAVLEVIAPMQPLLKVASSHRRSPP